MPVSSSSTDGDSSSNFGAGWWIERRSSAFDRAALVDRAAEHVHDAAEHAGPTGTEIGAPVLRTFMPRRRPSEEPMRDGAHDAVAELLLDLEREALLGELAALSSRTSAS